MPTKVAIIHDWLHTYRGGERVLEQLCHLYPQAEIFTLFYVPGQLGPTIENRKIHTSFIQRFPKITRYYRYLLPFFPMAIERFDLSAFDLVISSSHCVAKGVITAPGTKHICYCHTPMRYVWDRTHDYFGQKGFLIHSILSYLRMWDVSSSPRVDQYIANSQWVAARIAKYYGRKANVIYPPVDTTFFQVEEQKKEDYYLVVSAFAPYKRIDLAISACNKLNKTLYVVGTGQDEKRLRALAGKKTKFLGTVEGEELRKIYARAKALLFPGEEDFGIVPVEAMACGTPIIAYGRGGAAETVVENESGLFFMEQTVESLGQAIEQFESHTSRFSPQQCQQAASHFNTERFLNEFRSLTAGLPANRKPSLPTSESAEPPQLDV